MVGEGREEGVAREPYPNPSPSPIPNPGPNANANPNAKPSPHQGVAREHAWLRVEGLLCYLKHGGSTHGG